MPQVRATLTCSFSENATSYDWRLEGEVIGRTTVPLLEVDLDLQYGDHRFAVRGLNQDGPGPFRAYVATLEEPYVPVPPGPIGELEVSLVILGGGVGGGDNPGPSIIAPVMGSLGDSGGFPEINWSVAASAPTPQTFRLYRSTTGSDAGYSLLTTVSDQSVPGSFSHVDNTVDVQADAWYRLTAEDADTNVSPNSEVAYFDSSFVAAPQNVTLTNQLPTSIDVNWDTVANAVSYEVQKSTTSASTGFSVINGFAGLYDLSSFTDIPSSIVDNFVWPTEPSASTVINIPAGDSAALNSALTQSDVHIIVPAGTYDWSQDITGSDLWLDMDNGATLDADNYNFRNITGARTKITGGVISMQQAFNRGSLVLSGHSGDLHIENVNMNLNGLYPSSSSGGPSRVAILNNTIITRDAIIYADTVSTPGGFSNVDMIWAGNDLTKTLFGQAHGRTYDQNRLIVVDNRFSTPGNSTWRILGGSLDCFFGYNQIEADGEKPYVSVNHFGTLDSNGQLKIPDRIYFMNNTWYSAFSGANFFASFANEVTIQGNRAYQPDGFNIADNNETPPNPANYSDNLRVGPYQAPPVWTKGADH